MSQETNEINDSTKEADDKKVSPDPERNAHSIYDYVSKNPSIIIAGFSMLVAIITFFAKCIVTFSNRRILTFWEIDSSYATSGIESTLFIATASILYSLVIALITFWFSATYDAYLPYKKYNFLMRYWVKNRRAFIKKLEEKSNSGNATEEEYQVLKQAKVIRHAAKVIALESRKMLLWNLSPILFFTYTLFLFYFGACTAKGSMALLKTALVSTILQTAVFWLFAQISSVKTINRKKIRAMDAGTVEFAEMLIDCAPKSEYPLRKLFANGLRSTLSNITIVMSVIAILLNGFMITISYSIIPVDPIKERNKVFLARQEQVLKALLPYEENLHCLCSPNGGGRLQHPLSPAVRTWALAPLKVQELLPDAVKAESDEKKKPNVKAAKSPAPK